MENLNQQKEDQKQVDLKNPLENNNNNGSPENSDRDLSNSITDENIEIGALGIMQHSSQEILTPSGVGKVIDRDSEEEE